MNAKREAHIDRVVETTWKSGPEYILAVRRNRDIVAVLRKLVNEQSDDSGLWFMAQSASESYLQQELRKLHAVIEDLTCSGVSTQT